MTRILGLDLVTGSYLKIQYAGCLFDTLNHSKKIFELLSVVDLLTLLASSDIDMVAVDNISELFHDPRVVEYLVDTSISIKQLSNGSGSGSAKLGELSTSYGISLRSKPNSVKSAVICALLAERIGQLTTLYRKKGKIKYSTADDKLKYQTTRILSKCVNNSVKESTHRETFKQVNNSVYIDSITNVVGYGKESIVYRVTALDGRDIIVKVFRTYSSVAQKLHSETYKAKIAHIPLLMAKDESKYLQLLASHNINAPTFYFRDDFLIGMELIEVQGVCAPTLAELDHSDMSLEEMENLLYQALDNLFDMFKKCKIVHGDYSANNLLVKNNELIVIDVSQAKRINTNTFTSTPLRLRMDAAFDVLMRDLHGILTFFERKYQIQLERPTIYKEFLTLVPDFFREKLGFITAKWQDKFSR